MLTGHDVPAAGGGDATKERLLAIALQSGIIGQNDHDTQLRVERNRQSSTTPAAAVAPTRTQQGGRMVMHGAHLWEIQARPFASLGAVRGLRYTFSAGRVFADTSSVWTVPNNCQLKLNSVESSTGFANQLPVLVWASAPELIPVFSFNFN